MLEDLCFKFMFRILKVKFYQVSEICLVITLNYEKKVTKMYRRGREEEGGEYFSFSRPFGVQSLFWTPLLLLPINHPTFLASASAV